MRGRKEQGKDISWYRQGDGGTMGIRRHNNGRGERKENDNLVIISRLMRSGR